MNARSTSFEFTCLGKCINEVVSAIFHSVIFNRCFGKFQYKQENSYSIGTLGFEEVICDFIDFTYIRVASIELAKTVNNQIKIFVDELRALNNNNSYADNNQQQQQQNQIFTGEGYRNRRPTSALFNFDINKTDNLQFEHHTHLERQQQQLPPQQQDRKKYRHSISSLYPSISTTGSISLEFLIKSKSRPFMVDSVVWEVWTLKINCLKDDVSQSLYNNKISIEDQLFDKLSSIVSIINQPNAYLPSMPSESELDNVFDTRYTDIQPYNFKISYKIGGKDSNDIRIGGSGGGAGGSSNDKSFGKYMLGPPGQERLRKFFEKLSL